MNKDQLLDYLIEKHNEYKEKGFVPTIELLIEEVQGEIAEFISDKNDIARDIN
jgi:hypothetical protein